MLTLNDGRTELWQWDTGRMLSVEADCSQVHFSNKVFGRSIDVDVVDSVASIPDILLQTDKDLTAWAFVGTAENGYTKISKVFKVNKRNKPADYVFTPTDQTTLGDILDRIVDLENRPSGDVSEEDIQNAVNDYLDKKPISVEEKDPTVPDWAKQPNKPPYTAAEVGALPADTPIPEGVTDEQIKNAVDAYLTENPSEGGGIPIPSSAQVGQTIVVKAVDENGKPTEWATANMLRRNPFGDDWGEPIVTIITEEEVSQIAINDAADCKEVLVSFTPAYSPTATSENVSGSVWIGGAFGGGMNVANEQTWQRAATNNQNRFASSLWYACILGEDLGVGLNKRCNKYCILCPDEGATKMTSFIGQSETQTIGRIGFRTISGQYFGVGTKIVVWGRK